MPLRILKEKNGDEKAAVFAKLLLGAFDALEKKYLEELQLNVFSDPSQPDIVQESYSMKIFYPEGLAQCEVQGRGATIPDTKLSARNLLLTVVELCQGLAPLPENLHLSMKLLYHEEVTRRLKSLQSCNPDWRPHSYPEAPDIRSQ